MRGLELSVRHEPGHRDLEDGSQAGQRRHARVGWASPILTAGGPARLDELQLVLGDAGLVGEGLLRQASVVAETAKGGAQLLGLRFVPHR